MCFHMGILWEHKDRSQYTSVLLSTCHNDNVYLFTFKNTVFSNFLPSGDTTSLILPMLPITHPKLANPQNQVPKTELELAKDTVSVDFSNNHGKRGQDAAALYLTCL